jgi:hypothetical protein
VVAVPVTGLLMAATALTACTSSADASPVGRYMAGAGGPNAVPPGVANRCPSAN